MNTPKFKWYEEDRQAVCKLHTKHGTFIGIANCHPDDEDMMSEKVGCEIAYSRAAISSLKYERDNVINPSLKALKQLYYSMKHSKKFNPKSYENKMLQRQIKNWEYDLITINNIIKNEEEWLRNYIKIKEELYQNIRNGRK